MAKLKICGLTREADITAVNEVKPDFAGFVIEVPGRKRSGRIHKRDGRSYPAAGRPQG